MSVRVHFLVSVSVVTDTLAHTHKSLFEKKKSYTNEDTVDCDLTKVTV